MKFAITGATGFIGVHLIHHLRANGHDVVGIKRSSSSLSEFELLSPFYTEQRGELSWIDAELYDVPRLVEIFSEADYVIHTAGFISYHKQDLNELIRINAGYTAHVVNSCLSAKIKGLCHVSSTSAVSKNAAKDILDESEVWDNSQPHSNYGLSKSLAEMEVYRGIEEGLNAVIVNPGVVLGYGDWNKSSCQLFKNAWKSFPFYSEGITAFTGIRDLSAVIEQLLIQEQFNERFLVFNENASHKEVQFMMADALGKKRPKIPVKGLLLNLIKGMVFLKRIFRMRGLLSEETVRAATSKQRYSNAKVKQALRFEFASLETVINRAAEAYKKSPPR
ncbi:NAD-dependent epimerase/dehydratase family protein [bacterium]|nr:NAD-dependent epimerase/dehydratase family protein [bacterium]